VKSPKHAPRFNRCLNPFLLFGFCILLYPSLRADDDLQTQAVERYRSGLAYERLGRFSDAYTALQLAVNLNPQSAEMSLALGVVASRLGRYSESQRALEHSLALDANSTASYYQLALLYEDQQLSDRALECWHRFLALSQDDLLKTDAQKHIRYLEGTR
jgi:tetratricopeptide (TPR) repeat protein